MKSCGIEKQKSTEEILGYRAEDLKYHLECFPFWSILKNQKWDIDHIFPIKVFLDYETNKLFGKFTALDTKRKSC